MFHVKQYKEQNLICAYEIFYSFLMFHMKHKGKTLDKKRASTLYGTHVKNASKC